ncbi:MAG: hypothetical protein CMJ58_19555 [Planctomycetaceae bacterium]|nr:hypothetical protein [Planctomycetaceae bacterium]
MQQFTRRNFLQASVCAALAGGPAYRSAAAVANSAAWVDRRVYGPFQVVAAFPLQGLDRELADLGYLQGELQRTLAMRPPQQAVDVYLSADERSHKQFLQSRFPRIPYRRALYVQSGGRGAVYAFDHRDLPTDLRHECTHALLHTDLAMVPLWLDEGLAEYFEPPLAQRAFHHEHLRTLRWNLRLGMVRSIASLESIHSLDDMGAEEYRYAWAWAHFMLHGPVAAHRALTGFLADIRRGNPPGVLSARLEQAVPEAEAQLVRHFKHWRRG